MMNFTKSSSVCSTEKNVVYFVITESYMCSIYTSVPKTAEATLYYQCTIKV